MPRALLWIIGIVAGDFLGYLSHVARHRYDFLWNFHAIHHSQKELNFFTNDRFHDVDTFVDLAIRILPLLLLSPGLLKLGIYYTIQLVDFRFHHSPIRFNYGLLRYILVTPQSHRIHHASDPRQQNSNFGVFFSIRDHIFGTQYSSYDEYPEDLGLRDPAFPIEQSASVGQFATVYAAQVIYPFANVLRSMTSESRRERPPVTQRQTGQLPHIQIRFPSGSAS